MTRIASTESISQSVVMAIRRYWGRRGCRVGPACVEVTRMGRFNRSGSPSAFRSFDCLWAVPAEDARSAPTASQVTSRG